MSESTCIIAVDPGSSSGAIAVKLNVVNNGATVIDRVLVENMPDTPMDLYRRLREIQSLGDADFTRVTAVVENVGGSRPGNSARSSHTFAVHQGHLEMAFLALGIPVVKPLPRKWMVELFGPSVPTGPEHKAERKQFIYDRTQRLLPAVKFTKRQADAVGLLLWATGLRANGGQA